jgi:adenosylcobinamide-GDP ribazoletransferase
VTAFLAAVDFLTVAGRRGRTPDPHSLAWFGAVGLLVGGACGLVRWGTGGWWAPALAAALTVAADLVLTGALHLDGLADAADGLLPHLDRSRRLTVMAAPDVGAFAVAAVVVTLLLRTTALATADVDGWRWVLLLAGLWCLARAGMAAVVTAVPYARPEGGLATAFAGGTPLVALPSALIGVVAAVIGAGWGGLAGAGAGAAAGAAVVVLAWRRLGGFTGDVVGAAGLVLETVALVVVAARW